MNCELVGSLYLSKQILQKGCYLRIPTAGMCMYPFFKAGNIIIVKAVKPDDALIGDIILFWIGERMRAHRLLKKCVQNDEMKLLTKGDASISFDQPLCPENLLGKVIAIEKTNKKILKLDSKTWHIINYLLAMYSLALTTFIKGRNNHSNSHVLKIFRLPIIVLFIMAINFYFFLQKCKFITKSDFMCLRLSEKT